MPFGVFHLLAIVTQFELRVFALRQVTYSITNISIFTIGKRGCVSAADALRYRLGAFAASYAES